MYISFQSLQFAIYMLFNSIVYRAGVSAICWPKALPQNLNYNIMSLV